MCRVSTDSDQSYRCVLYCEQAADTADNQVTQTRSIGTDAFTFNV